MIGRRGERGSGISVLAARHDDDDDIFPKSKVNVIARLEFELVYNDLAELYISHYTTDSYSIGNITVVID